jgi:hypothetical protein
VNPCIPVPSVVKIFQESRVRTNFTGDLKKPHSWPRGKSDLIEGVMNLNKNFFDEAKT